MRKLKYIGHYAIPEKHKNHQAALSAVNKMSYICEAIVNNGYNVEIISASMSSTAEPNSITKINEHIDVRLFRSLKPGNKLKRIFRYVLHQLEFFMYLLKNIKKKEKVLVYHSLQYMSLITFVKRLKKFHLILEVEEIYSDVNNNQKIKKKEKRFFNLADSYIFSTELLDLKLNNKRKPSVVVYGTYHIEKKREQEKLFPMNREKKHLLYAGTFDGRKGGAEIAVTIAEFLPTDYHIHILGFGNQQDTYMLKKAIDKVALSNGALVTMDGLFSGEDYIRFVQSCDIGLSTQKQDGVFNDTSFPSKVLSYMANGLRVVSSRIPVLEESAVNSLIYYYDGNNPKDIAEVIKNIDWDVEYDSRRAIRYLDEEFIKTVGELLNNG